MFPPPPISVWLRVEAASAPKETSLDSLTSILQSCNGDYSTTETFYLLETQSIIIQKWKYVCSGTAGNVPKPKISNQVPQIQVSCAADV